jgi:hypothetical protein
VAVNLFRVTPIVTWKRVLPTAPSTGKKDRKRQISDVFRKVFSLQPDIILSLREDAEAADVITGVLQACHYRAIMSGEAEASGSSDERTGQAESVSDRAGPNKGHREGKDNVHAGRKDGANERTVGSLCGDIASATQEEREAVALVESRKRAERDRGRFTKELGDKQWQWGRIILASKERGTYSVTDKGRS